MVRQLPRSLHPLAVGVTVCGVTVCVVVLLGACTPNFEELPPPAKVPVTSEVLEEAPFQARLRLLGQVEPSSRLDLHARESGRLRYAPRFRSGLRTGERVRAGELLFEVDNEDVRLSLAEAKLSAQAAEAELERARRGVEGGFLAEVEVKRREVEMALARERLARAESRVDELRHGAPMGGVLEVDTVLAPGTEVAAQTFVARLTGDGAPVVEAWAAASDLERLTTDQNVECRAPGTGELLGRGTVREIGRGVDRMGTARLVAQIDEDFAMPAPGEGVELEVLMPARDAALTVPQEAVIVEGGASRAFVLETSGSDYKAQLRIVQLGLRHAGRLEVLGGLQAGERIAVRGAEFLADGLLATEAEGEGDE